jgi:hypothetical protein
MDVVEPIVRETLWSEEVARANAKAGYTPPSRDVIYEFSGGRVFYEPQ